MSSEELAAQVDAARRVINAAPAVQALRVAQVASRVYVRGEDGLFTAADLGPGYVNEFAGDLFGPMLVMSHIAAERKVRTAAVWVSKLPRTLQAMADGDLDSWRATVIADELGEADAQVCAVVEEQLYPRILAEVPQRARSRVCRELAAVDLDALRQKAARARLDRFVRWFSGQTVGMTEWLAQLPTAESVQCKAAVDDVAHRMRAEDPSRTLDQCRADAFVDLLLGNATVTTTVSFAIPVESAVVDDELPREPRARTHPIDTVDPETAFDTRITRVLLDPYAGVVRESGSRRYRPPPRMVEFVRMRDGTCRFPGRNRQARRCDVDHIVPYPRGQTTPANLLCLCRHHHRAKHETAWRVVMSPNGTCTWTDPFGQQFRTDPVNHYALSA